jgi:alpha-beta hydrolase superfamily lysophospholipase
MARKPPWWLSLAAATFAAAGTASALYQAAAEARDRKRYPPPGQMISVGGRSLHLLDMGAGSLAVVIIQALGAHSLDFLGFYRELAASGMRVIVYDRAGLGWSQAPALGRRTHDDMARELHDVLAAAKIAPPYLLAGHSFGGIIARRFEVRYPRHRRGHRADRLRRSNANDGHGTVSDCCEISGVAVFPPGAG